MWLKGKLYSSGELVEGCIGFDRRIRQMKRECKPDLKLPEGSIIMPAGVDMHVHLRGLELSYKETVATATSEAVYGGVGVVVDMPNTLPVINSRSTIDMRLVELSNYSRTDYGIYSGVTSDKVDDMPIAGYKVFPEDLEREEISNVLGSNKLKVLHPEIPMSLRPGRGNRRLWQELASIYLVKGNFHVTHSTNLETVRIAKGHHFTTDLTMHHLLVEERDCLTKVNPPIRDTTERRRLISALFEVDAVASDHAPHSSREKELPYELCPPGIAGVSFNIPFIYTLAFRGVLTLSRAVELTTENPSKILGIDSGEFAIGKLANLVIIRKERWRYSTKFSKVIHTPLDGFPLDAAIFSTIVEGKVAYLDGDVYPVRGSNVFDKAIRN
ncbi:dihydroorotase [Metallosphaera tengchongensis]|uniref:Dihydroorotase n=1 Tax=Metallosphaera tengchongensis TaxID=1532350 RepID=A0A6N0NUJ5_9CREN|nr:dihydroorotase [Metallosphaera tengchongensis]QKQ99552.1 dihydroorotase [Metallosphaera tengchongensis]